MSDDYPHPIIAREGSTFLAIAVVVAAPLTGLGDLAATQSVTAEIP